MEFRAGDEIGPYRVVRALGRGGMGTVYEVEHANLGVHYALKTFTLADGNAELFRQRFLVEGKVLARLRHPNITKVFDLEYDAQGEFAYFVMELVHYKDGNSYTLADLEVGGADEDHLIRWFSQIASALDYIHNEGIVHRDIKLNNILLNDRSGVMLSDFGISRFVGERIRKEVNASRTMVTVAGRQVTGNFIMGTEGYMAPEILRGEEATCASDTYALGITFFRLLTGIWYEPGTDVMRLLEPFDDAWTVILPRMVDADPNKRPINLAALAEQLKSSKTTKSLSTIRTKIVKRRPYSQLSTVVGFVRCRWRKVVVSVVVGAMIAAGIWFWCFRTESDASFCNHIYDIPACLM